MVLFTHASKKISASPWVYLISFCQSSAHAAPCHGWNTCLLLLRYAQPFSNSFCISPERHMKKDTGVLSDALYDFQTFGESAAFGNMDLRHQLKSRNVAWDWRWDGFRAEQEAGLSLISPLFIPSCIILTLSSWGYPSHLWSAYQLLSATFPWLSWDLREDVVTVWAKPNQMFGRITHQ